MTELYLHNSATHKLEAFVPVDPANVRIYVCGPTVYDLAHLGNARTFTVFDTWVRLLRYLFPRVTYIRNITDVDDKINARAAESGESIGSITARTTADFHADMLALGNLPPDQEPRATAHIGDMIMIINRLIASGHAYEAAGHVLFAVGKMTSYGALSGRDREELISGARVEVAPYKRYAGDFVLWKPSEADSPGWDSPWGRGRPGWHIECSAMSWRYLGESFDIHGGGQDLIFPHHENERAQSLCAFPGSHFAEFWLHTGMLLVNGDKMSKSLGNFITLRQALSELPAEVVRLTFLKSHYRGDVNYSNHSVKESKAELDRFYRALAMHPHANVQMHPDALAALCDDLNTPRCIAEMHDFASRALAGDAEAAGHLKAVGTLLGLLRQDPVAWFQGGLEARVIETAISDRLAARKMRDFAKADQIRRDLLEQGIILEDGPGGTTWRKA